MAFCKECGAQLSDRALFCGTCGARVTGQEGKKVCPNCRAEAPSHMIFCAQCGTRLGEAAAVGERAAPSPCPDKPDATARKKGRPRETVLLWCCLGIGLISYLAKVLWPSPENLMSGGANILLAILFVLQTPCLLLSMAGLFHRRISGKGWAADSASRARFLLAAAVMESVLLALVAYQVGWVAKLLMWQNELAVVVISTVLHILGLICAALALGLGSADGLLHWRSIGVVMGLTGLFSLVNFLYLYTGVFWEIQERYLVPPNYFLAPYELALVLIVVWKLCCESLRRVPVRPVPAKLSVATGVAAVAVLAAGITQRTGALHRLTSGALSWLYLNCRLYDPVLLPLGLLLVILCGRFCLLAGRDAGQPGQGG